MKQHLMMVAAVFARGLRVAPLTRWRNVLLPLLLGWPCATLAADETLVGEWKGSVRCTGEPKIKLNIKIKEGKDGRLSGEVEFSRGYLKSGYTLEGPAVVDKRFTLKAGNWTTTSLRIVPSEIQGEFFQFADKTGIKGPLPVCKRGKYTAYRARVREETTPTPPVAKNGERNVQKLTNTVNEGVRVLVGRRDRNWWRRIELSIMVSRVDRNIKESLLAEVRLAKANVFADLLLEKELVSGPMTFPQGIGRAIFVFRQAQATDWPDNVKARVYKECQKRVVHVLRPELEQISAMARNLPDSLDGLIEARAALNRVDTYKASLEHAFGTMDRDNILPPMRARIAELEASPAVANELRARLDTIVKGPNPRATAEHLSLDISGFVPLSEPLATIMKDGWRRAAFAEIVISDNSGVSLSEPTARDIAWHVFNLAEMVNDGLRANSCKPGLVTGDLIEYTQCALGTIRTRVKSISKSYCEENQPGEVYTCYFGREQEVYDFITGEITNIEKNPTSARFTKLPLGAGWTGSALGLHTATQETESKSGMEIELERQEKMQESIQNGCMWSNGLC